MAKKKGQKGGRGREDAFRKAKDQQGPPRSPGGGSGFNPVTIAIFVAVAFIMFNQDLRDATGSAVGFVLDPVIGFGGQYPALTIFLASLITGLSSGLVRHYFVDWLHMARVQETMKAFQKELKQARKDENKYKVKKLTELQPELMQLQAEMSGQQFKPMGYTMVIVIPMFAWLWNFIQGLEPAAIHAPWAGPTELLSPAPLVSFFPTWILIYMLFSVPIGQLVQKGLKAIDYSRTLKRDAEAL